MGVFSENAILGASNASGYDIDNSARFNNPGTGDGSPGTSRLTKTFGTATNNKVWTVSLWAKRGQLSTGGASAKRFFGAKKSGSNTAFYCGFEETNTLSFRYVDSTDTEYKLKGSALYRDTAAWYHCVFQMNTAHATSTERMKMWVNGEQITEFASTNYPPQNNLQGWNENGFLGGFGTNIGNVNTPTFEYGWDGQLAECHFVDGQALTPTDFGETNADTNQWQAIKYTGTHGNNGFYFEFKNSANFGVDSSANASNWTAASMDADNQLIDTPQNSNGGNFSTLNRLFHSSTAYDIREGNLKFLNSTANWWKVLSTMGMTSGKWYCEVRFENNGGSPLSTFGAVSNYTPETAGDMHGQYVGQKTYEWGYHYNGYTETGASNPGTGTYASYAATDKMGCAIDVDNLKIYWAKNGTWQNSGDPTSGSTGTGARDLSNSNRTTGLWYFGFTGHQMNAVVNFGQDSSFIGAETAQGNTDANGCGDFYYTPPAGYLALCTDNLTDPSITKPEEYFNTILWSGTGGNRAFTGVGFQPDFVWQKARDDTWNSALYDSVRGVNKALISDSISAELDQDANGYLSSFDSDGFGTTAGSSNNNWWNDSTDTYVAWNWKAGGAASSNTDGDITTSVSANTTSGFSIGTYTGNGTSTQTIGHGLSVAPDLVIIKSRENTNEWTVGFGVSGTNWTDYMYINQTAALVDDIDFWRDTYPTASVITLGSNASVNQNTIDYVFYAFHNVDGYSRFGSGPSHSSSSDGYFYYTGFKPAYFMWKKYDAASSWSIYDAKRNTTNVTGKYLTTDTNAAEVSGTGYDFVSNGVKQREAFGNNIIWLAFAESPFKYSNAR